MTEASDKESKTVFDIAVIGGGMVGIPLAIGLAQAGFKVALLEKFKVQIPSEETSYNSFDARSTALSLGSVDILASLNLWNKASARANPIRTVHVSEQGRMGTTRIDDRELDLEALGYVVPNIPFGQSLVACLLESDVCVLDEAEVKSVLMTSHYAELSVLRRSDQNEGEQSCFQAKLVIAADGANSPTAKRLGVEYQEKSYEQFAIVANVETELANGGVAFERFARTGPLALLPLRENTSALVWTLSEHDLGEVLELSDDTFAKRVSELFGERLGRVTKVSQRVSYPLTLKQANESARSRFMVVGNAAHSLHPVAGQGFNLALRGVAGLIEGLTKARNEQEKNGPAYWTFECLSRIADEHKPEQRKVVSFSDQLIDIFSPESHIPALARSAGLVALNGMASLKAEFAKHAMGRVQQFELEKA